MTIQVTNVKMLLMLMLMLLLMLYHQRLGRIVDFVILDDLRIIGRPSLNLFAILQWQSHQQAHCTIFNQVTAFSKIPSTACQSATPHSWEENAT